MVFIHLRFLETGELIRKSVKNQSVTLLKNESMAIQYVLEAIQYGFLLYSSLFRRTTTIVWQRRNVLDE